MTDGPVTVLFTDLVSSTELLQRVGDEQALRVLRAHQRLLRDAVAVHGGQEVKWTGDGLMTTFASSADAVRCAVAMQQTTRGRAAGERLAMRAGLHVGEALRDESDWVGASVVVARRLCDRAAAGQILCSGLVVELLSGRRAFRFDDVGPLELKGFAAPVAAWEVRYDRDDPAAVLRHTPFTGRATELARLERRLEEARGGHGGVVMLAGEPGIGKTRTLEEFADAARAQEVLVLWGRCYEGEAARPYGPFAEALAEHVRTADAAALRADLGSGAAPLTRLVPVLRERLPDIPEPVTLDPWEERVRLLDAVAQFLLALASRTPTVLVLDDLHWADPSTVAVLCHVARFAPRARLLLVGAYRDVEVDRGHPLADALGTLPRETSYEQVALQGLEAASVATLVRSVTDRDVPAAWADILARETSGNPFFIREVLLQLTQEGGFPEPGDSQGLAPRIAVPATVRQVVERRLGRLSNGARTLLEVSAAFSGGVQFEVARRVAELEEATALDASDEALAAQLLVPTADRQAFNFSHALVRHTLYDALSPPRQARLHRAIAQTIEVVWGERAMQHAAEIAEHYHRSRSLPCAEGGAAFSLAAAQRAEAVAAHAEAARFWRITLELLAPGDGRRASALSSLSLALTWALDVEAALQVASEAKEAMSATHGMERTADYLGELAQAMAAAGHIRGAWACARDGLAYVGDRRDRTWIRLTVHDVARREAEDPRALGIPIDGHERRDVATLAETLGLPATERFFLAANGFLCPRTSAEAVEQYRSDPWWFAAYDPAGDFRLWRELIAESCRNGRIAELVTWLAYLARVENHVGNFAAARAALDESARYAQRVPWAAVHLLILAAARYETCLVAGEGFEELAREQDSLLQPTPEHTWSLAAIQAGAARVLAWQGQQAEVLSLIAGLLRPLDIAPGWAPNYAMVACDAAEALWLLGCSDHLEVVKRHLSDKILVPDLRYVLRDVRRSIAHLCALQGRYDEAADWFAKARTVLDEQGARPLRAIVDYDEALMYARRGEPGDAARARPLLDAALAQFRSLGMPGWIRRAEALLKSCAGGDARTEGHSQ
jgi:class 3 adenylate cyclase/tetratricopeptide (TPR) repeat protein